MKLFSFFFKYREALKIASVASGVSITVLPSLSGYSNPDALKQEQFLVSSI